MQEWGGKNAIKFNLIPFYFSAHTPVKMKMGWYCLWLSHWHVTETRAKWHVTFSCFQVGWILAHLRQASTNARLYTFESQSGVNSCSFEVGFNKCQIVHFWVSKWGEFLHIWGRLQQIPDCTLLSLKVGWILAHFKTLDHDMSNSFEIFACMLHADLDTKNSTNLKVPIFVQPVKAACNVHKSWWGVTRPLPCATFFMKRRKY